MKPQDITELITLAARLRSTAGQLERAAGLLRLAGDLTRLEQRAAELLRPEPIGLAIDSHAAPGAPAGDGRRPAESVRLPPVETSQDLARIGAVFGATFVAPQKNTNNTTGGQRPAIQGKTRPQDCVGSVRRGRADDYDVPF